MKKLFQRAGLDLKNVTDPAQFGVVAALLALAAYVIYDAAGLRGVTGGSDPLGPKPMPYLIGGALIVVSVFYTIDILRGGRGEPEGGEDVDLTEPIDWRTLALLAVAFVLNAVLIEPAGWVISSSILFWLSAYALGNRRPIVGLVCAVTLALTTFYGFAIGLGVNLPAGILEGIL